MRKTLCKPWILLATAPLLIALAPMLLRLDASQEPISPTGQESVSILGYFGEYRSETKESGRTAESLGDPRAMHWTWSHTEFEQPPVLGVLFPNHEGNDPYWQAARRGVCLQAKSAGLEVLLLTSNGYQAVEQHQRQFDDLLAAGVDAIILASIHYRAMDAQVAAATASAGGYGIPVVELINDIHAPAISAKALVSFMDMGTRAGQFVLEDARASGKRSMTVALLPGPIDSGWAPDSLRGFVEAIRAFEGELHILPPRWGSPEGSLQRQIAEEILDTHQRVDYLVGNAVAAREATSLLEMMGREQEVTVISTYFSRDIRAHIANGRIAAAPSDQTEMVGRMAVGMAVRLLDGQKAGIDFPFRAGPEIPLVTAANVDEYFPGGGGGSLSLEPEEGRLPCF